MSKPKLTLEELYAKIPSTVKDKDAFLRAIVDWSWELDVFKGTKITPMNFDQVLEHKGYFFVKEVKFPDVKLEGGQQYTYEKLIRKTQGSCIVGVQTGYTYDTIERLDLWYLGDDDGNVIAGRPGKICKIENIARDGAGAKKITEWWWDRVNNNGGY